MMILPALDELTGKTISSNFDPWSAPGGCIISALTPSCGRAARRWTTSPIARCSVDLVYRLIWRLPLADLVAFSHLQFSQIRGRQPYLIVRRLLYVISATIGSRFLDTAGAICCDSEILSMRSFDDDHRFPGPRL